jgi:hypothetical protein
MQAPRVECVCVSVLNMQAARVDPQLNLNKRTTQPNRMRILEGVSGMRILEGVSAHPETA